MIAISHIGAQSIVIVGSIGLDLSVSEEGEPVSVAVSDIIVLHPRVFDRFEEMNGLDTLLVHHPLI
jgi:hypothetical protein